MLEELNDYIIPLDNTITSMIDSNVAEKGIENYLSQQLVYLDCSRIYKSGFRAMQTIGYPYRKDFSSYLYALNKAGEAGEISTAEWLNKLIKRHDANLEYEKENPPVWYGGKKAKAKWDKDNPNKLLRKRKYKEQTITGFGKEISASERLKRLSANFGNLNFGIKLPKK